MPDKDMRILIVGLGSIGQRHLRNLLQLGYTELYAVSSGKGTMSTSDLPLKGIVATLEEGLQQFNPSAVFICNPTSMHISCAMAAAKAGAHIFMEKPIAVEITWLDELKDIVEEKGLVFATGFQFRQHPTLQSVRNLIRDGRLGSIHAVRMHWGEYLPAWHPWEDYRKSYSALAGLGGGVTYTLSHPFDYLHWMLGKPESVQAAIRQTGSLDIEVDDLHISTWQFPDGAVATVHLNYLEQPARHELTVVGSKGKVEWSNESGAAVLYDNEGPLVRICTEEQFNRNHLFIAELRDFLNCIADDRQPECGLSAGIVNLNMILAGKLSSDEGRRVSMDDND